jgi:DNA polymerase-3 subunit delta
MPKLDITKLDSELRKGNIRPIYAVVGPEMHLRSTARKLIEDAVSRAGGSGESRHVFSAKEIDGAGIVENLKSVSLFSGRNLVIVREADKLKKDAVEVLTGYAAAPVTESTLVLEAEKLDGRSKFMRVVEKNAAVVECKALYANQLPSWVGMEVKRQGKQISMEAARFLAEIVGNDLGQLAQAIERVSLYVGDRKLIELKDIEEAVVETAQRTVFELGDAIGNRRVDRALSILTNLLDAGQAPLFILNMISRHVRILIKAREVGGKLGGGPELARYLGVHPFFAKNYAEQAKNFSAQELRRYFRALARCDRSLKSSRLPRERILEKLIFELCNKRQKSE